MKKRMLVLFAVISFLCLISLGSYALFRFRYRLVRVPVASRFLKERTYIGPGDISYVELPSDLVGSDIITETDSIEGSCVRLDTSIPESSFFYRTALERVDSIRERPVKEMKDGEVTYDLFVRDVTVNCAYLQKGMYCDIYATIRKDRVYSDLLLSGCRILALYNVNSIEISDTDKGQTISMITLAVDKESIPYLNKALASGTLRISVSDEPYNDVRCSLNLGSELFGILG